MPSPIESSPFIRRRPSEMPIALKSPPRFQSLCAPFPPMMAKTRCSSLIEEISTGDVCSKALKETLTYKTELCRNFIQKGHCKWANLCRFAHTKEELRVKPVTNHFYKTKVCRNFHKLGFCSYGNKCQYFHFKKFEVYQNLQDSLEEKLLLRLRTKPSENISVFLELNESSQERLSVFRKLHPAMRKKSLYERFLENEY